MKVKIIIALSVLLIPVLAVFLYPGDEGNAAVSYTLAGMEMVVIPGGSFIMGSPENEDRHGTEEKQHKVEISGFSIGRYEVTQKQYRAITGKNPSRFKGDNLPVESIDWYDAVRFCNMLSKKYGLTEYYKINGGDVSVIGGDGFRLPTEAEWEFACRAGTLSAYYWGNSVNGDYAWYSDNSDGKTHPSGQKKPNGFGLYDMAGNVWEWCQDWSGEYAGDAVNPAGAEKGDRRILRGFAHC
jgi:formylglycine-generating enzyme required for sulfatase activity